MSDIIYHKILKALELTCPLFKQNLITQAFIVGSVAKGTAHQDSDIDIYLVNPEFKHYLEHLSPEDLQEHSVKKIVDTLTPKVEYVYIKKIKMGFVNEFWYSSYKEEMFHFMIDYEFESMNREYIEITRDFCDMLK